jgi:hypothetical protein
LRARLKPPVVEPRAKVFSQNPEDIPSTATPHRRKIDFAAAIMAVARCEVNRLRGVLA